MTFTSTAETAMILPVPVTAGCGEDAVQFVALDRYRNLFDDLETPFQRMARDARWLGGGLEAHAILHVRHVGAFEASVVPRIDLWDRLDARFRIPDEVWEQLPAYKSFGFVVFKLRSGTGLRVHPMALSFQTSEPGTLFFPTLHVHDGTVPAEAAFDHTFYTQNRPSPGKSSRVPFWMPSPEPASKFLSVRRTGGLVDGRELCFRASFTGTSQNTDTLVAI
jgi:hypothetical protein